MPDDKLVPELLAPVVVSVVGTGDGLLHNTTAQTPPDQPNIVLLVTGPLVAIVVRFVNVFLVALVGLLTAAITPDGARLLHTSDFYHLVLTCASLSLPIAGLGFIKDLTTIFGKLEGKYPLLTGSV